MSEISTEYAKALFMLALENDKKENYLQDLCTVNEVLLDNPEYKDFLSSPKIPLNERLGALEKAFGETLSRDVLSFLKLLCEKKYIKYFKECKEEYETLFERSKRVSNASVKSAVSLSEKEKSAIKEKLEKISGHTVNLNCVVDEGVLGGLIIELDGKIIDSSLKRQLKDIEGVIIK